MTYMTHMTYMIRYNMINCEPDYLQMLMVGTVLTWCWVYCSPKSIYARTIEV